MFQNTMPLIQDLKTPVIRERHWISLKSELIKILMPRDDFTLEKVFTLGLHMHSEFIATMSNNATRKPLSKPRSKTLQLLGK